MGTRLGSDSDVEKLARIARKSKFDVYVTRSNHIRWVAPPQNTAQEAGREPCPHITSPLTFGDKRRIKAIKKFLVEYGCEGVRL